MVTNSSAAWLSNYDARPSHQIARTQSRQVNLLALAQAMGDDAQLRAALQVAGTAILGVATDGVPLMIRLASPDVTHVLISGAKASGKTQILRALLASLALFQKAREIQFIAFDSTGSAFEFLTATPHLLGEIATTPERALQHLRWLENELERREAENSVRPRLVVAIDYVNEFLTHGGREFQVHLARLAQRGRSAGISLLLCTNKANGSDLNANLRANFPVRLVGKNTGGNEGAEKLAGRGDFILTAGGERVRFQAAYFAPQETNEFAARLRAEQAQHQNADAGLSGFVKRLRRMK